MTTPVTGPPTARPSAPRGRLAVFEAAEVARLALAEARRRRVEVNLPRGAALPPLAERLRGLS